MASTSRRTSWTKTSCGGVVDCAEPTGVVASSDLTSDRAPGEPKRAPLETDEKCVKREIRPVNHSPRGWTIGRWRSAVSSGELDEGAYLNWWEETSGEDPAWIYRASTSEVAEQLEGLSMHPAPERLPLLGVPVAVKDNIDVRGFPTTAGCPRYEYLAESDAAVVDLLRQAGAIFVGKTNLDQFATGLVGTRSPYGAVPNPFDTDYISGGSSSGSGSVVGRGIVPLALGTDTAGSGRVPAAFHAICGLKPTRGWFSTRGVVPACRTLDCVSIFTLTVDEADFVSSILGKYDPNDPFSRPAPLFDEQVGRAGLNDLRLGVVERPEFFGDDLARRAYEETKEVLGEAGVSFITLDFLPFRELAELLYSSAWVAERSLVAKDILAGPAEWMDPTVRAILEGASKITAEESFSAEYRRADLARQIHTQLDRVDALLVPTTPTIYRTADVLADPLGTNARLGTYTNFTNLADLCALALPGRFRSDGLPSGITLLARAFCDATLSRMGQAIQGLIGGPLGATGRQFSELGPYDRVSTSLPLGQPTENEVDLAVVGAHLSGMALNGQLVSRGARLVRAALTANGYRLYALPGTNPEKPGLVRDAKGRGIALEVWRMSLVAFGSFVKDVPPPLGIGNVELEDGTWVKGFICEPYGLDGALEITEFGGFLPYLRSKS